MAILAQLTLALAWTLATDGTQSELPAHADLELSAELLTPPSTQGFWPIRIAVSLTNRSTHKTWPIVLPGDGSDVGWREPHTWITGELLDADGEWKPFASRGSARCGNYDADWRDEVVALAPGESLRIEERNAAQELNLNRSGRARLRMHYAWTAKPARAESWDENPISGSDGLGRMCRVAPFELTSAPIEIELLAPDATTEEMQRDLALELSSSRMETLAWERLDFDLRLVNRSTTRSYPVIKALAHDSLPPVRFDFQSSKLTGEFTQAERMPILKQVRQGHSVPTDRRDEIVVLAPGESVSLGVPMSARERGMQGADTAELVAHYVYWPLSMFPGDPTLPPALPSERLGAMVNVAPFRLRSNVLDWRVATPLQVVVRERAKLRANTPMKLSSVIEVRLVNRSDAPLEIAAPSDAGSLWVRVPDLSSDESTCRLTQSITLGAREERLLFGKSGLCPEFDPEFAWTSGAPRKQWTFDVSYSRASWPVCVRAEITSIDVAE